MDGHYEPIGEYATPEAPKCLLETLVSGQGVLHCPCSGAQAHLGSPYDYACHRLLIATPQAIYLDVICCGCAQSIFSWYRVLPGAVLSA